VLVLILRSAHAEAVCKLERAYRVSKDEDE